MLFILKSLSRIDKQPSQENISRVRVVHITTYDADSELPVCGMSDNTAVTWSPVMCGAR